MDAYGAIITARISRVSRVRLNTGFAMLHSCVIENVVIDVSRCATYVDATTTLCGATNDAVSNDRFALDNRDATIEIIVNDTIFNGCATRFLFCLSWSIDRYPDMKTVEDATLRQHGARRANANHLVFARETASRLGERRFHP